MIMLFVLVTICMHSETFAADIDIYVELEAGKKIEGELLKETDSEFIIKQEHGNVVCKKEECVSFTLSAPRSYLLEFGPIVFLLLIIIVSILVVHHILKLPVKGPPDA